MNNVAWMSTLAIANCGFPERSEWELKFLRDAVDLVFDELVDL